MDARNQTSFAKHPVHGINLHCCRKSDVAGYDGRDWLGDQTAITLEHLDLDQVAAFRAQNIGERGGENDTVIGQNDGHQVVIKYTGEVR